MNEKMKMTIRYCERKKIQIAKSLTAKGWGQSRRDLRLSNNYEKHKLSSMFFIAENKTV